MFGYAVKWGVLEQNPCRNVPQINIPEQTPVYLSEDQVRTLLNGIESPQFRELVESAIHTGMRSGEILSLNWIQGSTAAPLVRARRSP